MTYLRNRHIHFALLAAFAVSSLVAPGSCVLCLQDGEAPAIRSAALPHGECAGPCRVSVGYGESPQIFHHHGRCRDIPLDAAVGLLNDRHEVSDTPVERSQPAKALALKKVSRFSGHLWARSSPDLPGGPFYPSLASTVILI
jgi:hypothetical protein